MKTVLDTFLELVQIDSPSGHEQQVGIYLTTWLKDQDFSCSEDQYGNILAYKNGVGEPLLLCAHMDTVEPGSKIKPIVEGGKIRSSGKTILGADNKAAIAAIIHGTQDYLAKTKNSRPIEILFSVKEETGGGVEFFDFKKLKSTQGIIFDIAEPIGTVSLSSPYIYNFYLKFKGKAAHASTPEKGIDALKPAALFVTKLETGLLSDGSTTINLGKATAGTGINTVAEEAIISGEVRSFDSSVLETQLMQIEELANECVKNTGATVEFSKDGYCAGYNFEEKDSFVQSICYILDQNGHKINFFKSKSISDSNPLVEAGLKIVTLGDGVKAAHTLQEEISLQSLEDMQKLVSDFLDEIR